jgi:DNA-binding CsgD family transcriptional regulator/PAS domain-containing protein
MGELDELLGVVGQLHGASVEADLWPQALGALTTMVGGVGSTLEVIDRASLSHLLFHSHGIPDNQDANYVQHYVRLSPRIPPALQQSAGELAWDYQVLDERGIDASPFYAEFLRPMDMRYAVAGILETGGGEFGAVAIQRSARHGHVSEREIELMRQVLPHLAQAVDTSRRLTAKDRAVASLREAVDWLSDGAALLNAAGRPLFANASLMRIAAADDGLRLASDRVEFAGAHADFSFRRALAALHRLQAGETHAAARDFVAERPSGSAAYRISLRPLTGDPGAAGLLLVHDPSAASAPHAATLQQRFGLTQAEAHLGLALCQGLSPGAYARRHSISPNTVYTHLHRMKEKCDCAHTVELIALLNTMREGSAGA